MNSLEAMNECVELLKEAYTPEGVVKWFDRPLQQLRWKTPLEGIISGELEEVVRIAESDGRGDS